jgi:hypothetical protein
MAAHSPELNLEDSMATPVVSFAHIANECEREGLTPANSERVGGEIARVLNVKPDEVGILRLEKQNLIFVYPAKLHGIASIPLNTAGSVAARAANSKRGEIINAFAQSKHVSLFESVSLENKTKPTGVPADADKHAHVIQKLMAAPVMGAEGVAGVIEVCRKGTSAPASGPDFSPADLQKLASIAGALAKCFK